MGSFGSFGEWPGMRGICAEQTRWDVASCRIWLRSGPRSGRGSVTFCYICYMGSRVLGLGFRVRGRWGISGGTDGWVKREHFPSPFRCGGASPTLRFNGSSQVVYVLDWGLFAPFLEEFRTQNSEFRTRSGVGVWAKGAGRKGMTNAECRLAERGWRMEDGGGKIEDGGWGRGEGEGAAL
jgi:hypothetical protein